MVRETLVALEDLHREKDQTTIHSVEVEAIFNSHGSPSDAELSANQIVPNSIVFVEGMDLEVKAQEDRVSLLDIVTRLGLFRIEYGSESDSYKHYKVAALDILDRQLADCGADELDSRDLWHAYLFRKLIEKDCVIFVADLSKQALPTDQHEELDGVLPVNPIGLATEIDPAKGLRRTFLDSSEDLRKFVVSQSMREKICVSELMGTLGALFDTYPVDIWQLATSSSNKLRVYTVWGTAHAYSLSQKLSDVGLPITTTILDTDYASFQNPDIDLGLKEVTRISLANLLYIAIMDNPFERSGPEILYYLIESVLSNKDTPITTMYVRAYQLWLSTHESMEQFYRLEDRDEKMQIFNKIRGDTLNLGNLLEEMGIDGKSLLKDPYSMTGDN